MICVPESSYVLQAVGAMFLLDFQIWYLIQPSGSDCQQVGQGTAVCVLWGTLLSKERLASWRKKVIVRVYMNAGQETPSIKWHSTCTRASSRATLDCWHLWSVFLMNTECITIHELRRWDRGILSISRIMLHLNHPTNAKSALFVFEVQSREKVDVFI